MLLDSDVMVDILRGHPPALQWLNGLGNTPVALPGLVAMELLQGCQNLADQQRLEKQLLRFTLHWPTQLDCQRAYLDFASYRLSHNLGLLDSLIGHTSVGLNETLATRRTRPGQSHGRHFSLLWGSSSIELIVSRKAKKA